MTDKSTIRMCLVAFALSAVPAVAQHAEGRDAPAYPKGCEVKWWQMLFAQNVKEFSYANGTHSIGEILCGSTTELLLHKADWPAGGTRDWVEKDLLILPPLEPKHEVFQSGSCDWLPFPGQPAVAIGTVIGKADGTQVMEVAQAWAVDEKAWRFIEVPARDVACTFEDQDM